MKNENVTRTVVLTVGLPASGKTTWAERVVSDSNDQGVRVAIVNNDNIRDALSGGAYSAGTLQWNPKFEEQVRKEFYLDLSGHLLAGFDVVLDNTFLNPKTLRKTLEYLKQNFPNCPVRVEDSFLDVHVNECLRRDRARKKVGKRFVGDDVILRMWADYVLPNVPKPEYVPDAPLCVVCDLDGTLANLNGRSPYDASNCDVTDTCNSAVQTVLKAMRASHGAKIVFMSGREDKDREPTMRFLAEKAFFRDLNHFELHMRATGDSRHDDYVKRELYDTRVRGKYNVLFVFDDRPVVVRMWKSLGLQVFNVGHGNEF